MKGCKYCNQKPRFVDLDGTPVLISDIEMVRGDGSYAALMIGADEDGRLRMYASGENESDDYYPKFCPECGRKLPCPKGASEKNDLWIKEY